MFFDKLIGIFGFKTREQFWKFFVEGVKFCIVGVINTVIFYAVYLLMLDVFHVNLYVSYSLGFVFATMNSYVLGNKFVFKKDKSEQDDGEKLIQRDRLIKVYICYIIALVLGLILTWIDVNLLGISEKLAPIVNLFITTPTNFLLNKFWAYKDRN